VNDLYTTENMWSYYAVSAEGWACGNTVAEATDNLRNQIGIGPLQRLPQHKILKFSRATKLSIDQETGEVTPEDGVEHELVYRWPK